MIVGRAEATTAALIISERLNVALPNWERVRDVLTGIPDPGDPERLLGPAEAARKLPVDALRAIMDGMDSPVRRVP